MCEYVIAVIHWQLPQTHTQFFCSLSDGTIFANSQTRVLRIDIGKYLLRIEVLSTVGCGVLLKKTNL